MCKGTNRKRSPFFDRKRAGSLVLFVLKTVCLAMGSLAVQIHQEGDSSGKARTHRLLVFLCLLLSLSVFLREQGGAKR